ncbi:MAG: hypothetical protein JJ848_001275 [Prochlorococcus marinus CUG1439]|uniref:hypothetical protein n=1 Tax=Prochlorococcus sp. MIT 1314 TaxID=3096220 RepID=UPI001B1A8E49|nr:hypothetical protein [Prochlorococcus sp. MIT 1314]MCR8538970.1 hypothetical protein [Prochlorococcus marinus CUG1439]
MNFFFKFLVDLSKLENISPLYSYWHSDQNDLDEKNRLSIANKDSPALYLFEKEPYKWEILFQSIIREIINGDLSSLKGLQVLLSSLSLEVRKKVSRDLLENKIINQECFAQLNKSFDMEPATKTNLLRFLRILLAIFTNPYGIELRRKRIHIYEKTGFLFNNLKNLYSK